MPILPKAIYMLDAIPIKIPMTFITEIEKSILKFIWKHRRQQIAKEILSEKINAGGIITPDFKLYYNSIAIKTAWYWHKNIHEDQWNRIEDPYMNPHNYAQLIFDEGAKNIQWRKDSLFNKCWGKWLSVYRKLDPYLSSCTSINSKLIKDLNIRPETLKLVEQRAGNTLEVISIGKDFLDRTVAAQHLRERMDKLDFIKLKSFCTTSKNHTKIPPTPVIIAIIKNTTSWQGCGGNDHLYTAGGNAS
jgi:uncharacterized protein (DUF736 family)